ncbi:rod-binding protein [Lentibacter algarum]|uniref:rod-binding protein n=1 Tax=Lentibacter algarum TaxID=576131 RepID=UPI00339D51B6
MTNFKPLTTPVATPAPRPPAEQKLYIAAQKLEATFLAEMLKSAGFGEARDAFGGGAGEEHFATFLTQAHAEAMVETGGIGLAQSIFEALKETQNDTP